MNTNKPTAAVPSSTAGSVINSKDATPKKKMMNGTANFPPGPNMVDPQKATMGMTGKAPAPPQKMECLQPMKECKTISIIYKQLECPKCLVLTV